MKAELFTPNLDLFPAALVVTNQDRQICYANHDMAELCGCEYTQLTGSRLHDWLTAASKIVQESYIMPMLLHEQRCEEIQLNLRLPESRKLAVLASAQLQGTYIYWTFIKSERRDKLYQELVEARRLLEKKALELHQQSVTDELTGLANRRELIKSAQQLFSQQQRTGKALSMLLLDIDHFKAVNDLYGHDTGDQVLRQFGQILQQQARKYDVIARFGGEEFAILLPETDLASALQVADRLHMLTSAIEVKGEPLKISIGAVVALPKQQLNFEQLFKAADQALYLAKEQGRNCTRVAEL